MRRSRTSFREQKTRTLSRFVPFSITPTAFCPNFLGNRHQMRVTASSTDSGPQRSLFGLRTHVPSSQPPSAFNDCLQTGRCGVEIFVRRAMTPVLTGAQPWRAPAQGRGAFFTRRLVLLIRFVLRLPENGAILRVRRHFPTFSGIC